MGVISKFVSGPLTRAHITIYNWSLALIGYNSQLCVSLVQKRWLGKGLDAPTGRDGLRLKYDGHKYDLYDSQCLVNRCSIWAGGGDQSHGGSWVQEYK